MMKEAIYIIFILTMSLGSCTSQKKLQTNIPFQMGEASTQNWIEGKEAGSNGTLLKMPIIRINENEVKLHEIYFRGKVAPIYMESQDGTSFAIARFPTASLVKPDIIMHADPKQEVGNQPPKLKKEIDFPFELAKDEAVIRYTEKGEDKYFKIKGIR